MPSTNIVRKGTGERIPAFIVDESDVQAYYRTDLSYMTYLQSMAKLEGLKRDQIPPITLELWYIEFLRLGWTAKKFEEQINKVAKGKKFGKIDLHDFMEGEAFYSETEYRMKLKEETERLIYKGKAYFDLHQRGYALNHDELIAAAAYASEQLVTIYDVERRQAFDDAVEAEKKVLKDIVARRKKEIKKLTDNQRIYLVNLLVADGVLPDGESPTQMIAYYGQTEAFADLIPDKYIKEAAGRK
ncbi:MAG: hypothetical protein ACM3QX_18415 [Syntrophomonadaceae bacterium]